MSEPEVTCSEPLDAEQRPIHPKAAAHLKAAVQFEEIVQAIHTIGRELEELAGTPMGRLLDTRLIGREIKNLKDAVKAATPYTSCPMHADCTKSCKACRGSQWVTRAQWANMPQEYKQ